LWYEDLLIQEDQNGRVDPQEAGPILASWLRERAEAWFRSRPECDQWLNRLDFLRSAAPEQDWHVLDEQDLGELIEPICLGKTRLEEVERVDALSYLQSALPYEQLATLDREAPASLVLPAGRRASLIYETGRPPVLSTKLQDLFGWTDTPRIAWGRIAIRLELLGPNQRPVQMTDDLRSFWTNTYQQVRKDLRARYPRHAWPEDALNAPAGLSRNRKASS
jgi:ATP-dependent helicase HrpB